MNKVFMTALAALAVSAAPAFAADMPVKAMKAPVAAPSPWDVAFGVAFQTDYRLRGISQSNKKPSENGYFEIDYTATDWLKLYAGIHGYTMTYLLADAEFDETAGARFTFGNFGLDVGAIYYYYPDGVAASGTGNWFEGYIIPTYKFNDWLSVGGVFDGGNDFNHKVGIPTGNATAYYYAGNATVTLPQFMPAGITTSINGELGRMVFDKNVTFFIPGAASYTYWDVGLDFVYKAVTLDLRYWDTNLSHALCTNAVGSVQCGSTFVATLKFDTTLSAIK